MKKALILILSILCLNSTPFTTVNAASDKDSGSNFCGKDDCRKDKKEGRLCEKGLSCEKKVELKEKEKKEKGHSCH